MEQCVQLYILKALWKGKVACIIYVKTEDEQNGKEEQPNQE